MLNNAQTEVTTEVTTEDSTTATTEDTTSTTEVSAIEEGESSSSEESSESSESESELYYDIGGEEVSASTVNEWKENGLRQSDYTKKSQANADLRKGLEAKQAEVGEVKTKLTDIISNLDSLIEKDSNPEELAELRDTDPSEYLRRTEENKAKKAESEKAKKELAKLKEAEEAEFISEQRNILMDAMPEWADPKKLQVDMDLMSAYVDERGFSDDDVQALKSNKLTLMALDAARYQALQKETAETEKEVQKAPNVIKAKVKQSESKATSRSERFYGK